MGRQVNIGLAVRVAYKALDFEGWVIHDGDEVTIRAILKQREKELSSQAFLDEIGLQDMKEVFPSLRLQRILLSVSTHGAISFSCMDTQQNEFNIATSKTASKLSLKLKQEIPLRMLPCIGTLFHDQDTLQLKEIAVLYAQRFAFSLEGNLSIQKITIPFDFHEDAISCSDVKKEDITASNKEEEIHWIKIQKGFSLLYIHRLGFAFQHQMPYLYFDADFHISFLQISVIGLYIAFDIPAFRHYDFGLQGLGVCYQSKELTIGGSFALVRKDYYEGTLIIAFLKLMISAMGIYRKDQKGVEHIFVYAALFYPLGGPPCFYVDALCMGIGLQYQLQLPTLQTMQSYPFLTLLNKKEKQTPMQVLQGLQDYLIPQDNAYFFIAGLHVTSFGIIRSQILLSILIKPYVMISLLGSSQLVFPEKQALVYATLNYMATYDDRDGSLKIRAALQSDSYLFHPACHLRGEFAVYTWMKGKYANDFVISIGGYHPLFEQERASRYPHYPQVERVAINWKVDRHVSISGSGYFALTPSCLMAGGSLSLVFQSGNLKAWLIAYADFLIQWKPWHYDLSIGVSVGASYRMKVLCIHKTFTIELGAQIHLWRPDFQANVRISWFIISFTIHFGSKKELSNHIHLQDVEAFVIPQDGTGNPCKIQILNGLQKELSKQCYLTDTENLLIEIHTAIPLTMLHFNGESAVKGKAMHVLPMGEDISLTSTMEIQLIDQNHKTHGMLIQPIYENVPYALWGNKKVQKASADMISEALSGIRLQAGIVSSHATLGPYDVEVLSAMECAIKKVTLMIPQQRHFQIIEGTYHDMINAYEKENDDKKVLMKNFDLQEENIEQFYKHEDYFHCPIRFLKYCKEDVA